MADIDAKKIEAGSLWRHKKRGSVYRVIDGSAQVQAPEDSGLTDYEVVVVYQSKAGETWVRRHSEFLDGRFEKLSEPPSKEWLTRMAAAEDGHEVGAGDKSKRPPECKQGTHTPDPKRSGFVIWGSCPHLKTVSETWESETLECAVCGLRYTLYDDEMR